MPEVSITGLTRITDPKPNKGGSTVLAWFDCEANGIALHGCAFVRTARRGLTVWPPKIEGRDDSRRCVAIADETLRREMITRAQETYRALGGTDGEWIRFDEADAEEAAERYARDHGQAAEERRENARDAYRRRLEVRHTVARLDASEADDGLQRFISGAS